MRCLVFSSPRSPSNLGEIVDSLRKDEQPTSPQVQRESLSLAQLVMMLCVELGVACSEGCELLKLPDVLLCDEEDVSALADGTELHTVRRYGSGSWSGSG